MQNVHRYRSLAVTCLVLLLAGATYAQWSGDNASALTFEVLMKATTSWDGTDYHYPTGTAEITAVKMIIHEGPAGPYHCHPVPAFGYVLQGTLKTETDSGQSIVFKAGDTVAEVMSKWHRSQVVEGPVEIIAFYAGIEGEQNTRMKSSGDGC